MNVLYTGETFDFDTPSLFLAGPSPRNGEVIGWRPEMLRVLGQAGFAGAVFVPEFRKGARPVTFDYLVQVEWELKHLTGCAAILFWVAREMATLPGFTTNVEFGRWVPTGKAFYGRPEGSPKNDYLDWFYGVETKRKPHCEMATLVAEVLGFIGDTRH